MRSKLEFSRLAFPFTSTVCARGPEGSNVDFEPSPVPAIDEMQTAPGGTFRLPPPESRVPSSEPCGRNSNFRDGPSLWLRPCVLVGLSTIIAGIYKTLRDPPRNPKAVFQARLPPTKFQISWRGSRVKSTNSSVAGENQFCFCMFMFYETSGPAPPQSCE